MEKKQTSKTSPKKKIPKDRFKWLTFTESQLNEINTKNLHNLAAWGGIAQKLSVTVHYLERNIKRINTKFKNHQKEMTPDKQIKEYAKLSAFENSYMMLSAYMLENLTKGIIIGETPEKLNETKTHDIKVLLTESGISGLNDYELQLCERLTEYSKWAGRYPGPNLGITNGMNETFVLLADLEIIRKWEKELTAKLAELISNKSSL